MKTRFMLHAIAMSCVILCTKSYAGGAPDAPLIKQVSHAQAHGSELLYVTNYRDLHVLDLTTMKSNKLHTFASDEHPHLIGFTETGFLYQSSQRLSDDEEPSSLVVVDKQNTIQQKWTIPANARSYSFTDNQINLTSGVNHFFRLMPNKSQVLVEEIKLPHKRHFGNFYYFLDNSRSDILCISPSQAKLGVHSFRCIDRKSEKPDDILFSDYVGLDYKPADRPVLCGEHVFWSASDGKQFLTKRFDLNKKQTEILFTTTKDTYISCLNEVPYIFSAPFDQPDYAISPTTGKYQLRRLSTDKINSLWVVTATDKTYAIILEAVDYRYGNIRIVEIDK